MIGLFNAQFDSIVFFSIKMNRKQHKYLAYNTEPFVVIIATVYQFSLSLHVKSFFNFNFNISFFFFFARKFSSMLKYFITIIDHPQLPDDLNHTINIACA